MNNLYCTKMIIKLIGNFWENQIDNQKSINQRAITLAKTSSNLLASQRKYMSGTTRYAESSAVLMFLIENCFIN